MNDCRKAGCVVRPASALRVAFLVALGGVVSACGGGYEKMSSQPLDNDYEIFSVVGMSGKMDLFLIKKFESEGKVALCGGFTRGTSALSNQGNRRWADTSQVYIGDTKIGTAAFMSPMPVYGFPLGDDPKSIFLELAEKDVSLPCVRSKVPWKVEYDSVRVERRGPDRIRVFD